MATNRAPRALSVERMITLPIGTYVIDGSQDISVKNADGLFEGPEMAPITPRKLHKYGPVHLWDNVTHRRLP